MSSLERDCASSCSPPPPPPPPQLPQGGACSLCGHKIHFVLIIFRLKPSQLISYSTFSQGPEEERAFFFIYILPVLFASFSDVLKKTIVR